VKEPGIEVTSTRDVSILSFSPAWRHWDEKYQPTLVMPAPLRAPIYPHRLEPVPSQGPVLWNRVSDILLMFLSQN